MDRLAHLELLYLKIMETQGREEARNDRSEAVLSACEVAKRVIRREIADLNRKTQKQ